MEWFNEPNYWSKSEHQIKVKTEAKTDFWRITHYNFIRNNGHFYFQKVNRDFVVEVKIRGNYQDFYDQAGIMIRSSDEHWLKTGIEYVDGVPNLSAVVTHGYSDWSFTPLLDYPQVLHLRVERQKEAIHLSYLDQNSHYVNFRMAYFPVSSEIQVGIFCASPEGAGYEVIFEDYQLTEL